MVNSDNDSASGSSKNDSSIKNTSVLRISKTGISSVVNESDSGKGDLSIDQLSREQLASLSKEQLIELLTNSKIQQGEFSLPTTTTKQKIKQPTKKQRNKNTKRRGRNAGSHTNIGRAAVDRNNSGSYVNLGTSDSISEQPSEQRNVHICMNPLDPEQEELETPLSERESDSDQQRLPQILVDDNIMDDSLMSSTDATDIDIDILCPNDIGEQGIKFPGITTIESESKTAKTSILRESTDLSNDISKSSKTRSSRKKKKRTSVDKRKRNSGKKLKDKEPKIVSIISTKTVEESIDSFAENCGSVSDGMAIPITPIQNVPSPQTRESGEPKSSEIEYAEYEPEVDANAVNNIIDKKSESSESIPIVVPRNIPMVSESSEESLEKPSPKDNSENVNEKKEDEIIKENEEIKKDITNEIEVKEEKEEEEEEKEEKEEKEAEEKEEEEENVKEDKTESKEEVVEDKNEDNIQNDEEKEETNENKEEEYSKEKEISDVSETKIHLRSDLSRVSDPDFQNKKLSTAMIAFEIPDDMETGLEAEENISIITEEDKNISKDIDEMEQKNEDDKDVETESSEESNEDDDDGNGVKLTRAHSTGRIQFTSGLGNSEDDETDDSYDIDGEIQYTSFEEVIEEDKKTIIKKNSKSNTLQDLLMMVGGEVPVDKKKKKKKKKNKYVKREEDDPRRYVEVVAGARPKYLVCQI